jgi:hypothetical protein
MTHPQDRPDLHPGVQHVPGMTGTSAAPPEPEPDEKDLAPDADEPGDGPDEDLVEKEAAKPDQPDEVDQKEVQDGE